MLMYRLRGGDGQDYGPVDVTQLRAWIAENRADGNTLVCAQDTTDWKPLREFPELAVLLGGLPPALPAVPIKGDGYPGAAGAIRPTRLDPLAVTALILGILGFLTCGLMAVPGLVCGLVSQRRIRKGAGELRGKEMALAGIIVSGLSLICLPVLAAMLIPALGQARGKAQEVMCLNNAKQLGLAARIYATDNGDRFPVAGKWCDQFQNGLIPPTVLVCPLDQGKRRLSYAFNERLDGAESDKVDPQTVLFFESNRDGWNVKGGRELVPTSAPHHGGLVVVFADGSVRRVPLGEVPSLRWSP
jgi:hypothetical protein